MLVLYENTLTVSISFFRVKILNKDQRMDFSEFRLKIRRCKTIGTNRIELESLEQDFNTID